MSSAVAARAKPLSKLATPANARLWTIGVAVALVVVSLYLRTRAIGAGFWIDEGLSVGIASHPFFSIPGLLHQDGSPPLYYFLLNAWMHLFGTSEAQTHSLSVLFAVATVPVGLWGGWSLFSRRAGLIAAALLAVNPFLTLYAEETRMYALIALLALVATVAFLHAFVFRRRRYLILFSLSLAAFCYAHVWGLAFGAGAFVTFAFCVWQSPERRGMLRDGLLAFGGAAALFAPWLPTLIYQGAHNGAPWALPPRLGAPVQIANAVLGGQRATLAILLGAGVGLVPLARLKGHQRTTVVVTLLLIVATLAIAWAYSQHTPAWSPRYLLTILGPLCLLAGAGFARAGWLGLVCFVIVAALWAHPLTSAIEHKGNARNLSAQANGSLLPGDLVVSTHPEEGPVLYYYLRPGLSFATTLGPTADPRMMDWRDALSRLQRATPDSALEPLLATLPPGHHVLLVRPVTTNKGDWVAPWTSLVRRRSAQWGQALESDPRFVASSTFPVFFSDVSPTNGLRAVLYTKVNTR